MELLWEEVPMEEDQVLPQATLVEELTEVVMTPVAVLRMRKTFIVQSLSTMELYTMIERLAAAAVMVKAMVNTG